MDKIPKTFTCDTCGEDMYVIFVTEILALCVGCLSASPEYEPKNDYKYGDRVNVVSIHKENLVGTVIYRLGQNLYEVELDRDKPEDLDMESYRDGRRCKYYTEPFHESELRLI